MRLGELFTGSLKQGAGPGKVLDPYIAQLETDVTVTYFMLPLSGCRCQIRSSKVTKKRPDAVLKHNDDAPPKPPKKTPKGAGIRENTKGIQSHLASKVCTAARQKVNPYVLGSADCKRKHVCAVPGCYKQHPQSEHHQ